MMAELRSEKQAPSSGEEIANLKAANEDLERKLAAANDDINRTAIHYIAEHGTIDAEKRRAIARYRRHRQEREEAEIENTQLKEEVSRLETEARHHKLRRGQGASHLAQLATLHQEKSELQAKYDDARNALHNAWVKVHDICEILDFGLVEGYAIVEAANRMYAQQGITRVQRAKYMIRLDIETGVDQRFRLNLFKRSNPNVPIVRDFEIERKDYVDDVDWV